MPSNRIQYQAWEYESKDGDSIDMFDEVNTPKQIIKSVENRIAQYPGMVVEIRKIKWAKDAMQADRWGGIFKELEFTWYEDFKKEHEEVK